MDPMITGAIIGASIGLLYAGYMMFKAHNRKGDVYLTQMTKRVIEADAPGTPAGVFAALKAGIAGHPAKQEAIDEAAQRIVFTDTATMTTQGFFYPIWITPGVDGSRLQIGIVSRGNQWGPLVTRAHDKFVAAVSQTLGLAEETV